MKTKFQLKCEHCKTSFSSLKKVRYCSDCNEKAQQVDIQKLKYTFKQYTLNADTIGYFQFMENRRKLANYQIQRLHNLMYNGGHFETPIVVNEIAESYRVIDGNHRLEAFRRLLKRRKKANMEIMLVIYEGLGAEEEIDIFRKWNMGRVQSINDFIMNSKDKIPLFKMLDDFPIRVTIYPESDSISFRSLTNAYLAAQRDDETGQSLKKNKYLEKIKDLDQEDCKKMKEFCRYFSEEIGPIERHGKKKYYCTCFFPAAMFIYYSKGAKKGMLRTLAINQDIQEFMIFRGRAALQNMIKLMGKWK